MDERTLSDWSVSRSANEPGSAAGAVTHTVRVTSTGDEDSVSFQCGINVVNGKTYPPSCGQQRWDMLDAGMQGRYRPSDVIIITYPKCGTTWAEQAALLLLNGGDKELLNPAHKNTYIPGANDVGKIWVEAAVLQEPSMGQRAGGEEFVPVTWAEFDSAPAPRVIKSHTSVRSLLGTGGKGAAGLPPGVKIVVVTRNPLDACVSCYYHAWNPHKSGWPFSAFAAYWSSGNSASGSWFDWTLEWWAEKQSSGSDRVHWIHFEDLKSDPEGTIGALATFLGVSDEAVVAKAVEFSSFTSMKQQSSSKGGDAINHLRKGESGDWRNHFNAALAQQFTDMFTREMAGSGLVYCLGGEQTVGGPAEQARQT